MLSNNEACVIQLQTRILHYVIGEVTDAYLKQIQHSKVVIFRE